MKTFIQNTIRALLPHIARLHKKNRSPDRQRYPQLWYCMPRRWVYSKTEFYDNGNPKMYRAKPRLILEWLCGILTGHEISATERGYGGGQFMDCNCRWCDKAIKIPLSECDMSPALKGLIDRFRDGTLNTELNEPSESP